MNIIEKFERNPNLIKHSATVHITNKITLLERKLYNILLKNAFDDLETKDDFEISISYLKKIIGWKGNNYDDLKKSLSKLRETGVEINVLKKDNKNHWKNIGLCSRVEIDEETGMCSYGFDSKFKTNFSNPNLYAVLDLRIQNKFKSKHAIAIWEFCIEELSVKKVNSTHTKITSIENLKKLLFLKSDKYREFKYLNRSILKPSISEINSKSDINISINTKKQNRKVSHISFFVERKNNLKDSKVTTFAEDLVRAEEEYQKNKLTKAQKQSSIFDKQKDVIIESDFESINEVNDEILLNSKKNISDQEQYPFTLSSIKQLISLGVTKKSLKKEFNSLIEEFSKEDTELLFDNFLNQQEIKDVISGKKSTESKSSYVFTLIKNRTFLMQENLNGILNQKEKEDVKIKKKENLAEKYKIRNDDEFWQKTKALLIADQILENLPKYLNLETINFSLIKNNVVHLLVLESSNNPKFQRDGFVKEKQKIIETMNKIDNSIKNIKVAVENDYFFF